MVGCPQWGPTGLCSWTYTFPDTYINDLDNGTRNWILKFADDTKIFSAVNNDADRIRLQNDLDKLLSWAKEWQMLFNVIKCKVMHIGHRNSGFRYCMDGTELDTVDEERILELSSPGT